MSTLQAAALAAALSLVPSPAVAQSVTAGSSGSPVAISDPFVIPWTDNWKLACMTFSNASDKAITAVRFGLTSVQKNPLEDVPTESYIDRIGSFAPGVAIRAPTRFLGTVDRNSPALRNCWRVSPSDIATVLRINVLKVVYEDGTVWVNPNPTEPLVSVTY